MWCSSPLWRLDLCGVTATPFPRLCLVGCFVCRRDWRGPQAVWSTSPPESRRLAKDFDCQRATWSTRTGIRSACRSIQGLTVCIAHEHTCVVGFVCVGDPLSEDIHRQVRQPRWLRSSTRWSRPTTPWAAPCSVLSMHVTFRDAGRAS